MFCILLENAFPWYENFAFYFVDKMTRFSDKNYSTVKKLA